MSSKTSSRAFWTPRPLEMLFQYAAFLVHRAFVRLIRIPLIIAAFFVPLTAAADEDRNGPGPGPGPTEPYNGSTPYLTKADTWRGNAQSQFFVGDWIRRGINLRQGGNDGLCYDSLIATLESVINIRLAEYSGSAGVLSLLPTIGALLGAPTNEIWRLWTVVPFGGVLTMLLSFGGAILPIKIEDYERDIAKGNGLIGSIVSFRASVGNIRPDTLEKKKQKLRKALRKRMAQKVPRPSLFKPLAFGLMGMISLLAGAHGAMGVVEQGGILPWYCVCRWWMHMWYILVTITSIAENWSQLPFDQQWRLFVSDVPYRVEIKDGDDIMDQLSTKEDSVTRSLHRLARLRAARVIHRGSTIKTQAVNTVIIMVSVVAHDNPLSSVKRLFTKMSSIAVFVTGTAFFAAVQLLALPMAVMVLTFILAAGVFGRGFANWIVTRIDREEPLIHIIVKDAQEAHEVISAILELDHQTPELKVEGEIEEKTDDERLEEEETINRLVQVEIGGHIFIKHRRVAYRSPWVVRIWGIMANPYDLRRIGENGLDNESNRFEQGWFGKGTTSVSSSGLPLTYQEVSQA